MMKAVSVFTNCTT